jgi:DmsE family decaheme c-type cytochrome
MHVLRIFKRLQIGLAMMALVLLLSAGAAADEKAKGQAKSAQPAAGEAAGQYVGSQTCEGCHGQVFKKFQASPHWITAQETNATPGAHGCEACHGPGSAHVDGGGDKTKIFTFKGVSSEQINQRCLACHQNSQEHGNWARGMHATNGVACTDCHSPHHAMVEKALLTEKTPQLCYRCHNPVKAEFARPFHHRVNEGLVQCTECHNVHGAYHLAHSLRTTPEQDQVCYRCHTDKQGPFAFEHEPVKTAGCMACHTPHGSVNARLLKTSQINLLCLQCHTVSFTPTGKSGAVNPNPVPGPAGPVHNQATRYQACTLCHPAIHGSNASSVFLK